MRPPTGLSCSRTQPRRLLLREPRGRVREATQRPADTPKAGEHPVLSFAEQRLLAFRASKAPVGHTGGESSVARPVGVRHSKVALVSEVASGAAEGWAQLFAPLPRLLGLLGLLRKLCRGSRLWRFALSASVKAEKALQDGYVERAASRRSGTS